jgi:hypothetical protein
MFIYTCYSDMYTFLSIQGMEKGWLDVAKEGFSKIISGDAMKATGLGGSRKESDGVVE